ncbi:hypothetical protein [Pigmentiphaga aceris]|nr:hypothetical protein [Pigmentiphaga aceris]
MALVTTGGLIWQLAGAKTSQSPDFTVCWLSRAAAIRASTAFAS